MSHTILLNSGTLFVMEFTEWLDEELENRHWNRANLAKMAHLTQSSLSHLYADKDKPGYRKPGIEMCKAIANVFGMPPEFVYRQAGLLPNTEANLDRLKELDYWFAQMTEDEQEVYLAQGKTIVDVREKRDEERRKQSGSEDDPIAHVVEPDGID